MSRKLAMWRRAAWAAGLMSLIAIGTGIKGFYVLNVERTECRPKISASTVLIIKASECSEGCEPTINIGSDTSAHQFRFPADIIGKLTVRHQNCFYWIGTGIQLFHHFHDPSFVTLMNIRSIGRYTSFNFGCRFATKIFDKNHYFECFSLFNDGIILNEINPYPRTTELSPNLGDERGQAAAA